MEDFHSDAELIEFLGYFSTGDYLEKEVELVINGDFLDLLAVPYIKYFDDEYWSEKAALEKLQIILNAHAKVFDALKHFAEQENKRIVYIIGNHDAEMIFPSLQQLFLDRFGAQTNKIKIEELGTYTPHQGVDILHGHEYEPPHHFNLNNIFESEKGERYFIPPLGSYYVTHIINKYKKERIHINAVRPIDSFIKHGLIFDTFFTMRFIVANLYYFFMVRFLHYLRMKFKFDQIMKDLIRELSVFKDYEILTQDYFKNNPNTKVMIVGHTHDPKISTGTWTRMVNLELGAVSNEKFLTFAMVLINDLESNPYQTDLYRWESFNRLPYTHFK